MPPGALGPCVACDCTCCCCDCTCPGIPSALELSGALDVAGDRTPGCAAAAAETTPPTIGSPPTFVCGGGNCGGDGEGDGEGATSCCCFAWCGCKVGDAQLSGTGGGSRPGRNDRLDAAAWKALVVETLEGTVAGSPGVAELQSPAAAPLVVALVVVAVAAPPAVSHGPNAPPSLACGVGMSEQLKLSTGSSPPLFR
jgi:hypothetical protein